MGFLTKQQLMATGFASVGKNVLISEKASVYGAERIELHDNIRIDDFTVISAGAGGITIRSHVHIACHVSIIGGALIFLDEFCGISGHAAVYSSTDDFSGNFLTGPTVAEKFRNVAAAPVHIGRHVAIGAQSVVMPGVRIADGAAVGALSLVNGNLTEAFIYAGIPAKKIRVRENGWQTLEAEFRKNQGS